MKIILKEKVPQSLEFEINTLDPKTGKGKFQHKVIAERNSRTGNTVFKKTGKKEKASGRMSTVETIVEIPDELVVKTIAVIDELLDRTWDELENRSWTKTGFPLVPFPFFQKYREPENVGFDDYWISFWLDTSLKDIIKERAQAIDTLFKLGCIEEIEHHPIVNMEVGNFDGDGFLLTIIRDELRHWRKELFAHFEKMNEGANKHPIRKTALQNIANEIKELTSHSGLTDFFTELNIPEELYEEEGSKYDKVLSVLSNSNQDILFKIIEESVHPLRFFGGDEERALQFQDLFSSFLQFDDYCIDNGQIIKSTPKTLKDIKTRIEKRRKEQAVQTIDNKEFAPTKEPLSIKIVEMPELKIEETKKENGKPQFPYKLPAGTVWENITFQFLDNENAFIQIKQHKHYTDYKEMGLVGRGKNPKPSELWAFLKVLAFENGEITINSPEVKTKYKKQKELLSKFLQSYFVINLDPFFPYEPYPPYKHEKSYKIRMKLIPPSQSEKKQNGFDEEDKDNLGIKENYEKQTPQRYEEQTQ